jgi:hypothetical protein
MKEFRSQSGALKPPVCVGKGKHLEAQNRERSPENWAPFEGFSQKEKSPLLAGHPQQIVIS